MALCSSEEYADEYYEHEAYDDIEDYELSDRYM